LVIQHFLVYNISRKYEITLKLIPKAMKSEASTLKVAEAILLEELSDQTMAVFPLPFPLINI